MSNYRTCDHSYQPFDELLDAVKKDCPEVLLLLGPFVDDSHPRIKVLKAHWVFIRGAFLFINCLGSAVGCDGLQTQDCALKQSFAEHFEEEILLRIRELLDDPSPSSSMYQRLTKLQVILVPSLRDVHHDSIFPQPPLPTIDHSRVWCFPNPCTIRVKEFSVGITTADIIFDLSKRELQRGHSMNRMELLANHLLQQRSYYPMYPPDPDVNICYEHLDKLSLPCTPDILICPSRLTAFVKQLHAGLVINPGQLTKHNSGKCPRMELGDSCCLLTSGQP